jgi:N-acetylglucosamine-6-sulfatase
LGISLPETPHLDSLASNGVHFENAFVTTSLCSPSRASIPDRAFIPFRHRVIDNNRLVPDGTLFFPQYLQKAGYSTGFIGKWHMGGTS